MSLPNSYHKVLAKSLGRRAWCVASVHGTENLALADPAATYEAWAGYFNLEQQQKPRMVVKTDDATASTVLNVGAQIRQAQAQGFRCTYQLKDQNDASRGIQAGTDELRQALDLADDEGVFPDEVIYGNEMDDEWSDLDDDEKVRVVLGIYQNLSGRARSWGLGGVASWGDAVKFLAKFIRHARDFDVGSPWGTFSVHQYRGMPWTPFKLGTYALAKELGRWLQVPVENHESDLSFTPGGISLGIHDYRGAAYALFNNLEHASHGVPCCDFTLQNGVGAGTGGNGLFKESGAAHPSGAAMRDIAAPFTRFPMLAVTRQQYDDTGVYANAGRELVVCRFSEAADQTADIAFRQSLFGQKGNWVTAAALTAMLDGAPPPVAPDDVQAPDWQELVDIYKQARADVQAGYKVVEIDLPIRASSVTVLGEVNDGTNGAEVSVTADGVRVKIYNKAAVYLRVD